MVLRKSLLSAAATRRAVSGDKRRKARTKSTQSPAPVLPAWDAPRLVALRGKLKMSQRRFAIAIGVSAQTIDNWESGRRNMTKPMCMLLSFINRYGLPVR
jgi:DNA-binding transcriptional regulator YiaG